MEPKRLSFNDINPYVRYPHSFTIEPGMMFVDVKPYDCRLFYIVDGHGYMMIDDIRYEAVKGHLFLWKPGIKYSILPDIGQELGIIGVNFDFTHCKSDITYPIPPEKEDIFNQNRLTECIEFYDVDLFNRPVFLKNMFFLETMLLELCDEYMTRKKFYLHKMRGIFMSILSDIAFHAVTTKSDSNTTVNTIDQIISYIHQHYHEAITNRDIGQIFNFNPIYINRLMVKHTGFSLHQYIINYRISKALNLLQSSSKSITEVAYSVGFNDINYFSRYFKKNVGISPKSYISRSRG